MISPFNLIYGITPFNPVSKSPCNLQFFSWFSCLFVPKDRVETGMLKKVALTFIPHLK